MRKTSQKQRHNPSPEVSILRAGSFARDNPVTAGGAVVMGLTACLIVANALGLQPGRHPAPLFATRDRPDSAQLRELDGRIGQAFQRVPSALVLDLQTALRRIGLYVGPLDGLNGPATERAIRAFERQLGQVETGQPSDELLAMALLNKTVPDADLVPVPRPKPLANALHRPTGQNAAAVDADPGIRRIQAVLLELGYGPLEVDGIMGTGTAEAIRRFERERGLPAIGEPSARIVERLELASGRKIDG